MSVEKLQIFSPFPDISTFFPVENVDKQPRGGKLTGIILGRYVTRKLPLVVPKQRVSNCNFSVEMPKRGKIFLFYFALCYGNFGACLL